MLNLLFVDITQSHGAANLDLAATVGELARRGHACALLALKPALFREALPPSLVHYVDVVDPEWRNMWVVPDDFVARVPFPPLVRLARAFQFSGYRKRVAEQFRDRLHDLGPDLVHCNTFNARMAPVVDACRAAGVPLVAHARSVPDRSRMERSLVVRASRVLALSDPIHQRLVGGLRVPAGRCTTWHNGLPFDAADRLARESRIREEYRVPPGQRIVLVTGRVARGHGQDVFLDAMIPLLRERADVAAFVVGRYGNRDREFADALIHRAAREADGERLHVIVDRRDEESFLGAADVLVRPHVALDPLDGIVDGFSRDLLLDLGMGVPVVTTETGGAGRIARDQETGLVVPAGDADALGRAVRRVLDRPDEARAMADRARAEIRAAHSLERRTDELLAIYQEKVLG